MKDLYTTIKVLLRYGRDNGLVTVQVLLRYGTDKGLVNHYTSAARVW